MRVRTIAVVAGLAAVLGVTVAVSAAAGKTQGADSITVWLQPRIAQIGLYHLATGERVA